MSSSVRTTRTRAAGLALAAALLGLAMTPRPASGQQDRTTPQTAPPEIMPQSPKLGGTNQQPIGDGAGSLTDKLSRSEGVIAPQEGGTDPGMVKPTPDQGGSMVVIPPPGSPGGDPNVRPK